MPTVIMIASRGAGAPCGGSGELTRMRSDFLAGYCGRLHLARLHFASSSRSLASSSRATGGKALECARFHERPAGIFKSAAGCLVATSLPDGASPPCRDPIAKTVAGRETKPEQDSCVRPHWMFLREPYCNSQFNMHHLCHAAVTAARTS